jgi:arylsulfatase A-like enzyme
MAEPHTTFENPAAYNQMYADYTNGEIIPIPSGLERIPVETLVPRGPGEYYANITYMDAQLGRVLNALDEMGQRENTIIVFTSDNGPVTSQWLQWFEVNAHGSTGGYRGRKHFTLRGRHQGACNRQLSRFRRSRFDQRRITGGHGLFRDAG